MKKICGATGSSETLFAEEKPILEGYYHTNRGLLWFNPEEEDNYGEKGVFCDEDGFPIYTRDKVKWWNKTPPGYIYLPYKVVNVKTTINGEAVWYKNKWKNLGLKIWRLFIKPQYLKNSKKYSEKTIDPKNYGIWTAEQTKPSNWEHNENDRTL